MYCAAFSDKFSCLLPAPERFICHGHPGGTRCINPEYVCDGKNDCWDSGIGYDEEKCLSKGAFQIILFNTKIRKYYKGFAFRDRGAAIL